MDTVCHVVTAIYPYYLSVKINNQQNWAGYQLTVH